MKQKNVMSEHQPSLSEWFKLIGDAVDAKKIQDEDNEKHARLEFLKKTIKLPYEETEKVEAIDLYNKTAKVAKIFEKKGEKLCAIRLTPKREGLPKFRNRGLTLNECYATWFLKQEVDFRDYYAEICPHNEIALWSMIIVVNKDGIFGEVISGHGFQLMHGETEGKLYFFRYDFKNWQWSEENKEVTDYAKQAIKSLRIKGRKQEEKILESGGKIAQGYLSGYFELFVSADKIALYNDYNRLLAKHIKTPTFGFATNFKEVTGLVAYPGKVVGKVQQVTDKNISAAKFKKGSILVTENTDIRFLPLMKKACAIVTERGSILSHASIVARELKIPCIVNVKNASKILKDGIKVEVDANSGKIIIK